MLKLPQDNTLSGSKTLVGVDQPRDVHKVQNGQSGPVAWGPMTDGKQDHKKRLNISSANNSRETKRVCLFQRRQQKFQAPPRLL